jgi:hypothetical protein
MKGFSLTQPGLPGGHFYEPRLPNYWLNRIVSGNTAACSLRRLNSDGNQLFYANNDDWQRHPKRLCSSNISSFPLRVAATLGNVRAVTQRNGIKHHLLSGYTRPDFLSEQEIILLTPTQRQFVDDFRTFMTDTVFGGANYGLDAEAPQKFPSGSQCFSGSGIDSNAPPETIFTYSIVPKVGVSLAVEEAPQPGRAPRIVIGDESPKMIESSFGIGRSDKPVPSFVGLGCQPQSIGGCNRIAECLGKLLVLYAKAEYLLTPAVALYYACKVGKSIHLAVSSA